MHVINQTFNVKSYQASGNMERESKITIEETSVNLGCVKKELEEFEFSENQYKVSLTYENIFGETSTQQRNNLDSLIGFLDDDIIMKTETTSVKEENKNVIRRNIEQFHCNRCGGNYEGYCSDCSSLSHILNNLTPNIKPEPDLNTTPINILEIKEASGGQSVFALKNLPKGVILGPFEGIASIESMNGLRWKVKNKKFLNDQIGNWMKYIESVANNASKNLDVFELDGILYFKTSREIQEGEELLVYYVIEEEVLKSDNEEEFYFVSVKEEEYPKVFACTLCCLGFRLEGCLVEHKSKCSQGEHGVNIENFELIQCDCCKVWLEKREHLESHMLHCLENYNRLSHNLTGFRPTNKSDEEIAQSIDVDASYSTSSTEIIDSKRSCGIDHIGTTHSNISEKEYKCSECSYQTNVKGNLKKHLNTHKDIKPFECDICKKRFNHKISLKLHIKNDHSNSSEKEYKCSECSYQTNHKINLNRHLNTHKDIKPFECDICEERFSQKSSLNHHTINNHSNIKKRKYKCSECSYQTDLKGNLNQHLNTHKNIKAFECDICKKRFTQKSSLKLHIQNKHSNTYKDTKPFECDICKKRFTQKGSLKVHIQSKHSSTHDGIKSFECDICKKRFNLKCYLKTHIRNQHSDNSKKEYKCSECSYQTKLKGNLKLHSNTHKDIKPFECDICKKRFTQKSKMNEHVINHHSNANEKKYKCSECSYQTNLKGNLKLHSNTHNNIKPFECDICRKRFGQKGHLKVHTLRQHANTSE